MSKSKINRETRVISFDFMVGSVQCGTTVGSKVPMAAILAGVLSHFRCRRGDGKGTPDCGFGFDVKVLEKNVCSLLSRTRQSPTPYTNSKNEGGFRCKWLGGGPLSGEQGTAKKV